MKISDEGAKKGILGYLSIRCDVSSQHKLPTVEDILSTWTAETIGRVRTSSLVDELLKEGDSYPTDLTSAITRSMSCSYPTPLRRGFSLPWRAEHARNIVRTCVLMHCTEFVRKGVQFHALFCTFYVRLRTLVFVDNLVSR